MKCINGLVRMYAYAIGSSSNVYNLVKTFNFSTAFCTWFIVSGLWKQLKYQTQKQLTYVRCPQQLQQYIHKLLLQFCVQFLFVIARSDRHRNIIYSMQVFYASLASVFYWLHFQFPVHSIFGPKQFYGFSSAGWVY